MDFKNKASKEELECLAMSDSEKDICSVAS